MEYLQVKDWADFQHYKDRCPPWIKLHRDLLNDYEFSCLQDTSKLHLMLIWLLASQMDNKIPADPDFIKTRLNLKKPINLKELIDKGFLIDASNALADCKQVAIAETEAEAETETEAETEAPKGEIVVPDFIDGDIWMKFVKHRGGKKFTKLMATTTINKLTKWNEKGHDCNEILNTTIMNGWKGVFEPKERIANDRTAQNRESLSEWVDGG